MTEMVERVARALAVHHYAKRFSKPLDDSHVVMNAAANWNIFAEQAAEAIKAMRIPSKAMIDAVEAEEDRRGYIASAYESMDAEAAWPVMVDAALNEQEKV